jgi:hypothetical protein
LNLRGRAAARCYHPHRHIAELTPKARASAQNQNRIHQRGLILLPELFTDVIIPFVERLRSSCEWRSEGRRALASLALRHPLSPGRFR